MLPVYCTREQVLAALQSAASSRNGDQIDRAVRSASRAVDVLCRRRFYPELVTRTFDWPSPTTGATWQLELTGYGLADEPTAVVSAGTTITDDVLARPDTGPPFTYLETDQATAASWTSGASWQRSITVTGVWGYTDDHTAAGSLVEALDATETGVDVSDSTGLGVGSLIKVDAERMIVTDRRYLATGQTLVGPLTASKADFSFTVADGTALHVGETINVGARERMTIRDILGNTVIVDRAVDSLGALVTHDAGAVVYAPRTLTVERASAGTTAATHTTSTAVYRWVPPPLVVDLTIAEAINRFMQEGAGYARTAGSSDNEREVSGRGLMILRDDARRAFLVRGRTRAV